MKRPHLISILFRNHLDPSVNGACMQSITMRPIVNLFLLTVISGTPLLSNAATLITDPGDGHVTSILGLQVGSSFYDATFEPGSPSFNSLWDADGDKIFGNDSSTFNQAPMFWGDSASAQIAAQAIMDALGSSAFNYAGTPVLYGGVWHSCCDSFIVPYDFSGATNMWVWYESSPLLTAPTFDSLLDRDWFEVTYADFGAPYVSFEISAAVPLLGAFWLFGSGLLGLVGIARRKKAA